jgi:hypothetical protein
MILIQIQEILNFISKEIFDLDFFFIIYISLVNNNNNNTIDTISFYTNIFIYIIAAVLFLIIIIIQIKINKFSILISIVYICLKIYLLLLYN